MGTRNHTRIEAALLATLLAGCGSELDLPTAQITDPQHSVAEVTSLSGKIMFGYQGWFGTPGDGSARNRWVHWSNTGSEPDTSSIRVDMWPDTREYPPETLFDTGLTMRDGSPARLFSSYPASVVDLHFEWMARHNLDGVFLQRFTNAVHQTKEREHKDQVARNVMQAASRHGRVFALMYDVSGTDEAALVSRVIEDWQYLVDELRVLDNPRYLHHGGAPVLAIWGLGFTDRPGTVEQAHEILDWFASAPPAYQATLMAGVPWGWRSDPAQVKPGFDGVYERFDVISPWATGSMNDDADVEHRARNLVAPEIAHTRRLGIDYMPVAFPGFSWANMKPGSTFNQIPRRGGRFIWKQFYEYQKAGASMIYVAMFDEVDEGTAMFEVAANAAQQPVDGRFVALDEDGETLPSDWYLQVASQATRMLRQQLPLTPTLPITPTVAGNDAAFVSQQVPAVVTPGERFEASITMRNIGTTAWSEETEYRLGSQSPQDNQVWGFGRVHLPEGGQVAPNATHTFLHRFTAPSAPGDYVFQWRMLQEYVEWFGATTPSVAVRVVAEQPEVFADLNPTDVEQGLRRPTDEPGDGDTVAEVITDACEDLQVWLRRTEDPGDLYVYLDVDDGFIHAGDHPRVAIDVQYWDHGTGTLTLQYDNASEAYARGGSVTLTGSDCMRSTTFQVEDAWFGNRQNNETDFRLVTGDGAQRVHINRVGVRKL